MRLRQPPVAKPNGSERQAPPSLCFNRVPAVERSRNTGHEHYDRFRIINANARLYDPMIGRFFSPDPFVQAPGFTQNYNRYSYCLNNPVMFTDPDGENPLLVAAAAYFLFFTETGYEVQKYVSPVAFHIDVHLSGEQRGIGVDASVGIPKNYPISYRTHLGATYYWRHYDNSYQGWEQRHGGEWTFLSFLSYSGTTFKSGGTSQTTNMITVGNPYINLKYENDYMFDMGKYFPGVPAADNGDRYRTAAARIKVGPLTAGVNLFTGDPGLKGDNRLTDNFDYPEYNIDERETYVLNKYGDDPDEYRAGVFYIGLGSFRFGTNSEKNRHIFQNRFAHDILMKGDSPYFKLLDMAPRWYYYFGSGTGNSL